MDAQLPGVGANVRNRFQVNLRQVVPNPGAERPGRRMQNESASLSHSQLNGQTGAAEAGESGVVERDLRQIGSHDPLNLIKQRLTVRPVVCHGEAVFE